MWDDLAAWGQNPDFNSNNLTNIPILSHILNDILALVVIVELISQFNGPFSMANDNISSL
jgi:hypothetical protein